MQLSRERIEFKWDFLFPLAQIINFLSGYRHWINHIQVLELQTHHKELEGASSLFVLEIIVAVHGKKTTTHGGCPFHQCKQNFNIMTSQGGRKEEKDHPY